MKVQEYLKTHTYKDLEEEFGIHVNEYDDRVSLNYHQIDSHKHKFNPLVMECRGLILSKPDNEVLCRSFDRFWNYGEDPDSDKFDITKAQVDDKIDGCLPFRTPLKLWYGGTITIGEVVSKKLNVTLVGQNENGDIVPTTIKNYFNNGFKENWIELYYEKGFNGGYGKGKSTNVLRITDNHHIVLNGKYQSCKNAKIGDKIIHHLKMPSNTVLHFIKSSLLGDGSISSNGHGYRFTEGHTQQEYRDYIDYCLGDCKAKNDKRKSGLGSDIYRSISKTYHLDDIFSEWYRCNNKKVIPDDLSWIDDFSIAKWYMDDGSLLHSDSQSDRAMFHTHCFDKRDVIRLIEKLKSLYYIDAVEQYTDKGWCIRINKGKYNSIENFWCAISNYIIPCMRYKLPKKYRDVKFVKYSRGIEWHSKKEIQIIDIKIPKTFPHGKVGFDIQTETGNYFAKNILVHNSLCNVYHDGAKWQVATRKMAFAEGPVPNKRCTYADIFKEALGYDPDDCFKQISKDLTIIFEMVSPETRVVTPYKEKAVYLLDVRNRDTGLYLGKENTYFWVVPKEAKWLYPQDHEFKTWEDVIESSKALPALEEGYVARIDSWRIKVKNPAYLAIAHLRENGAITAKRVVKLVFMQDHGEYLLHFPEDKLEFDPYIEAYQRMIDDVHWCSHHYMKIEDQKEFALKVKDRPAAGILFALRKGRDLHDILEGFTDNYKVNLLKGYIK